MAYYFEQIRETTGCSLQICPCSENIGRIDPQVDAVHSQVKTNGFCVEFLREHRETLGPETARVPAFGGVGQQFQQTEFDIEDPATVTFNPIGVGLVYPVQQIGIGVLRNPGETTSRFQEGSAR
jgi:hypothetical protein